MKLFELEVDGSGIGIGSVMRELEKQVSRGDIYPLGGAVGKAVLDGRWGYRCRTTLSGTLG